MTLVSLEKTELLKRAKRHYFSTGIGDGASYLCRANMKYGLAKIHLAQEEFGLVPHATCISTPDETVTRNTARWKAGFGYGGKLTWGSGKDKFIILDSKPNACGMLVGALEQLPEPSDLIEAIHGVKKDLYIDNFKIDWDMYKGNHFIDLFKVVKRSLDIDLPEYAFIMHGSVSELRDETEKGIGLYYDKSEALRERAKIVKTIFGKLHVLIDSDAEEYYNFYKYAEWFAKEKRKLAAEAIFGKYEIINNITHQGLLNYNELILGAHDISDESASPFPIALRADLPAFLMTGKPNLDDEIIELLGFEKRAEKLGVLNRLKNVNIAPHGGGYSFSDVVSVIEVIEIKGERYFILDMANDVGSKICSEVREMEFDYRGKGVVLKTIELGMAEVLARLIPQYVLKI